MARASAYHTIIVESFRPGSGSAIHVRPIAGQFYPQHLLVECSRSLTRDFPVGTRFRLQVKLTDRQGDGEFLYSYYGWPFEVLKS